MTNGRDLRWSIPVLVVLLALQAFWRAHTFGSTLLYRPLIERGLAAGGTVEPLDCDEAIYAYMGRRMLDGDVLYRDLSENKPPLGYWIYALTVRLGGANEWSIRLMPYPFVLSTTVLVWWIARSLGGSLAGLAAAFLFALVSTDPYLFGNGANLEHEMNFFAVASLAAFLRGWRKQSGLWIFMAGALLGSECLIKQTAILPIAVFVPALLIGLIRKKQTDSTEGSGSRAIGKSLLMLALGFGSVWVLALAILGAQGALREGFDHFVVWASALARETPPDPGAPPGWIRWLVGNADPRGVLPWPFGNTDYLVWWGTGAWPLWFVFVPALLTSLIAKKAGPERRLVAAWTLATCFEVVLSGLFWQHYYLLPVPGLAIMIGLRFADAWRWIKSKSLATRGVGFLTALTLILAAGWTIRIQTRDYLLLTPEQITSKFKGGAQWVALRQIGRELDTVITAAKAPRTLYVWGWQSPLYLYGELDAPTPFAFSDPLLKALSSTNHPLIRPRVERIVADLKANPPSLILAADRPFPALADFLADQYVISYSGLFPWAPDRRGLWIKKEIYARFEAARGQSLPGR